MFPKSEPLQSLMTSYFQNGRLIMKKHVISLKGHIFRRSYYYQSIEMYTQRFQNIIREAKKIILLCHSTNDFIRHTHIRLTAFFSGTTQLSRYQKGKTNLDFTEARDSEWQWHQLGRMRVCTSLQTDNHASTPPLSFLQAGCPSCRPTNSVKTRRPISWQTWLDALCPVLFMFGAHG